MTYHSKAERLILLFGEIFLAFLRPLRGRSLAAASLFHNIRQRSGVVFWQNNTVAMQKKNNAKFGLFLKRRKNRISPKNEGHFGGFLDAEWRYNLYKSISAL